MSDHLFHGDLVSSRRIIYTPSEFAKSSLVYLQEIGELHAQKPHMSRRENLASFLFFTVVSGSGTLVYDGESRVLSPGDCVFIDCRKPYSHETGNDLWSLRWIHFNGAMLPGIYAKYIERGGMAHFHPEELSPFHELWNTLFDTASSNDYIRDMRLNEKLNLLLTLLMQESWHQEHVRPGSKKQTLAEIRSYLDENYNKKITLDELSERYFINKFYLTRVFKEQYGSTINAYLTDVRITQAKHLLRFTEKTVEEIGMECGLGALNYFSRTFSRIEGISPSEYRKLW